MPRQWPLQAHLLQCQEVELRGGAGNASCLGGLAQQRAARLPAQRAQLGSLSQRRQAHACAHHHCFSSALQLHHPLNKGHLPWLRPLTEVSSQREDVQGMAEHCQKLGGHSGSEYSMTPGDMESACTPVSGSRREAESGFVRRSRTWVASRRMVGYSKMTVKGTCRLRCSSICSAVHTTLGRCWALGSRARPLTDQTQTFPTSFYETVCTEGMAPCLDAWYWRPN